MQSPKQKPAKPKATHINIYLPEGLLSQLKKEAEKQHRSMSNLIVAELMARYHEVIKEK